MENNTTAPQNEAPQQVQPETESEQQLESSENQETETVESAEQDISAQDAQNVLDNPNSSKKEKQEAKKTLKKLKIKYNNKEYEEELPFEIPDDEYAKSYMAKHLQLSKMGHSKAQEKAQLESEIRDFFQALKENPREILANPNIGIDIKKLAKEIIEQEIENEKKSPEQLKAEQLEKELKQLKEEREKEKERQKQMEMEKMQKEAYDRYDQQLEAAFEKNKDIPKTPYFLKRITDLMILGLQNGLDVTPDDVIPILRDERKKELQEMFSASSEDLIEELIGKDKIAALRKKSVAKAKAAQAAAIPSKVADTGGTPSKKEEPVKKVTIKDWFKV